MRSYPATRSISGYFPSLKLGRSVAFSSTLERDLITQLEFTPSVTWYQEQPLALEYRFEGRIRRYIPDFQVYCGGGEGLLECKFEAEVRNPQNLAKFEAARAWCETKNGHFTVVTEHTLRGGFRLKNVQALEYYARYAPPVTLERQVFKHLGEGSQTLGYLIERSPPTCGPQTRATVLHLAYHHRLALLLEPAPLCAATRISLAEEVSFESWSPFSVR